MKRRVWPRELLAESRSIVWDEQAASCTGELAVCVVVVWVGLVVGWSKDHKTLAKSLS
jgi:hypothetical protein